MKLGIEGKVAFVSGGSSGIGKAIAIELAREGAHVMIAARREGPLKEASEEINASFGQTAYVVGDMSVEEDIKKAIQTTRQVFGDPDIVIANVRSVIRYGYEECSAEDFRQSSDALVSSVLLLAQETMPKMKERKFGRFINLGSVSTKEPHRWYHLTLGNTFRLAAVGLLRTIANEVAPYGITVNSIAIGLVETGISEQIHKSGGEMAKELTETQPKIMVGRAGTPNEIAGPVAFLCSTKASYITGHNISVDGGWTRCL